MLSPAPAPSLIQVERVAELRAQVRAWRAVGARIACVPTMGNLHAGHLSLVQAGRAQAERVVVTIFVNPLQFGPHEDLDAYPRTLEDDRRQLEAIGCDLLFTPSVDEMYPRGQEAQTRVEVPGISDILCGASRPGHFVGVATVVCKLLNMIQPDVALFGEKDFQQLVVIRRMVEDLALPVEIIGRPTVREPDGLALSSRNGYLTPAERALAPNLYRVLQATAERLQAGEPIARAEQMGMAELAASGLRPDYLSVRRVADLAPASPGDRALIILAAAYLGRARLIDNRKVDLE
ncbi:MAG: pantoate--beta-alanine ligase [Thermochromatium sp.]